MTLLGLSLSQLLPLFAGASSILVALYLLKQRRRRLEVPFSKLWQKVLRQSESTSLWQALKRWLSLLLALLILSLLLFSLGDPRLGQSQTGRTLVLLIDASASMQAIVPKAGDGDKRRNRLALAKDEARKLVKDLGGDDLAVVVALDGQPAPRGGLSQDEPELLSQIDAVTEKDEPADLARAMRLCKDLLLSRKNPQVVLISDGGYDNLTLREATRPLLSAKVDLRYVGVGTSDLAARYGNVAITAFSVRRYRHNRLSYEVLLEVSSFPAEGSKTPVTVEVELLQEGEVVDLQKLTLQPGERLQRLYPNLAGSGVHLEARLQKPSVPDLLPLDDHAYALLPEHKRQKLLLVTRGNLFLEGALLTAAAGEENQLEIRKIAPADYKPTVADESDIVLFDDFTPPQVPRSHAIYLNPKGPGSPIPIGETIRLPLITDVAKDHPLLRWVTLKDLNIAEASVFRLGKGDLGLAAMLRKPIIAAQENKIPLSNGAEGLFKTRRILALGFDLRRSDLPLRVAFPVMLVNSLDWFAGDTGSETQSFATGRTWRIPLPGVQKGQTPLRAPPLRPGEQPQSLSVPIYDGYAFFHGSRVGFYELIRKDLPGTDAAQRPLLLAANLMDVQESAASVRRELQFSDELGSIKAPEAGRSALRRVIWPYLVLLALVLLLIEWWTYQRRWTV